MSNATDFVIKKGVLKKYTGPGGDVAIPDSVTSIDYSAFNNTAYYKNSDNWENGVLYIGNHLIRADPKAITGYYTVRDGTRCIAVAAFDRCTGLTGVTIPDSVIRMVGWVFCSCQKLKHVTWPSALAKALQDCMPKTEKPIILHIEDISSVSSKFRPGAALGFAEDQRDRTDENGKKYLKYIKANAAKLAGLAVEHPALLYLMIEQKLIAAKDLEAVTSVVQKSGNTELIAAVLHYGNSSVSAKDKVKAQQKKDERETNVTNFVFDSAKVEVLQGKKFAVAGKLKTFGSHDELKECLTDCGATLIENLESGADFLITNTRDADTEKHRIAIKYNIPRITEEQFNEIIGRGDYPNSCMSITTDFMILNNDLIKYTGVGGDVVIPEGVTSICWKAFCGCVSLTGITIPKGITIIGAGAFEDCKQLTDITIPDGVTSICSSAFEGCKKLTRITIPDSVTNIERDALYGCRQLTHVTCPSSLLTGPQLWLPEVKKPIVLHIDDISGVLTKFRPGAALGFAEDQRDCTDESGKKFLKYIKANAAKLASLVIEHPALLYLMIEQKLIDAKDLEAVTSVVQKSGNTELIAAVLNYGNSFISA